MKIRNYFLSLFLLIPVSVEASFVWKNQVDTQHYIFENYYNDLERFHNEDDHLKNSELLKIPLPKINRIISDYDRYIDYRNSEFQNIGDKFQTYVLLEYPIDQANQLLFEQIKQDSILSNQEAIDSALEELEAEIKKKN